MNDLGEMPTNETALGAVEEDKAGARILIVTPRSSNYGENPIIAPAMGPYLLHSYISSRGVSSTIFDRDLEQPEAYLKLAAAGHYDVIGFGVTHQDALDDLELIWQFKEAVSGLDKPVAFIAGGQEAAMNYKQWLRFGFDLVFLGFAQKTLLEFCRGWHRRMPKDETLDMDIMTRGIPGVVYLNRNDREIYVPSQPITQSEFNELFYDEVIGEDQLPYDRYWDRVRKTHADTGVGAAKFVVENVRLYTTSHCPRKCGFCNSQSFLPDSIGGKMPIISIPAEETAELIRQYSQRYGARGFSFNDDDFLIGNAAGLNRVFELCERLIEFKKSGEIPEETTFACQTRVNNFITRRQIDKKRVANRELLDVLKKTGFRSISLGVESFIQRIIKAPTINKLGVTAEEQLIVLEAMLEAGIVPQINIILGVPEYTPDELARNMEIGFQFLRKGCDIGVTRRLYALPGAPIYGSPDYDVVNRNWVHPQTGENFEIADYLVPLTDSIRTVADRFDEMARDELQRTVETWGWEGKLVHRRIVGMASFIACARLLGRDDLVRRFRAFLSEAIDRRQQEMVVV